VQDKTVLRQSLLANRQQLAPEVRRAWDDLIAQRVLAWWRASDVRRLGVYWPMRAEPDLRPLYRQLADEGAVLALPLVTGRNAALAFAEWEPGDELVTDRFGFPVPAPTAALMEPQAVLIPCVGFNARHQRLGYGGGYYDRTLAMPGRPAAIGVAYASSLCAFEGDTHDIALDRIITEQSRG
jgi:5-formyltetrahydrofolate cyclo-ligase